MKVSLPKGTRDFLPAEVFKREYIFNTIRETFETYGYLPIQTPSMENLSTLTGKYGDEGDNLLFKVLNNGDYLNKANPEAYANKDSKKLTSSISSRGMRYDLTVPFARFVVMHQNDIAFPFKRYQIQPVWRGDRPQKGRYQEFYQCDADVVGSDSLMYEAELVQIFDTVFSKLKMDVTIKINNRKILNGIAEVAGIADHFQAFTVSIDKLDKIGMDKVKQEMLKKGIPESSLDQIASLLEIKTLDGLEEALKGSEIGLLGVEELRTFHKYSDSQKLNSKIEFDITLARGLNYYTGCILEVKSNEVEIGSIAGGGRYADLTGVFGLKDVSGVGISFGAARIFDCLEELNRYPDSTSSKLKIMFLSFNEANHHFAFQQVNRLRSAGISTDIYPSPVKFQKQMKYANKTKVPYIAIIGDEEMESGTLSIKHMETGTQEKLTIDELIKKLS